MSAMQRIYRADDNAWNAYQAGQYRASAKHWVNQARTATGPKHKAVCVKNARQTWHDFLKAAAKLPLERRDHDDLAPLLKASILTVQERNALLEVTP